MGLPPGPKPASYLGGAAAQPAWDALFFYRHAKRYDEHHARAPITSALLDSIELCRVHNQAPEILFSALRPHHRADGLLEPTPQRRRETRRAPARGSHRRHRELSPGERQARAGMHVIMRRNGDKDHR